MTRSDLVQRSAKPVDAWWTVLVVDPIAIPIVGRLEKVAAVRPNHLTVASLVLGLASAGLFFAGHPRWAAVAFELHFLLDCIDGKLARVRGTPSRLGGFLDISGDVFVLSLIYAALGSWLVERQVIPTWMPALLAAMSVYHYFLWILLQRERAHFASAEAHKPQPEALVGLRAWLAHRRLGLRPRQVDIEALVLFIVPLVNNLLVYRIAMFLALAFYAATAAQHTTRAVLLAMAADRTARS